MTEPSPPVFAEIPTAVFGHIQVLRNNKFKNLSGHPTRSLLRL